ncbi:MAG TPA: SpoIIE family protein phosphatase, partial [Leptospiraceae bacterium]|nr:SpoIIE family protein phosphatase [Leptospiraceae bacterium]
TRGFGATGVYTGNSVYITDYRDAAAVARDRIGLILIFLYLFVGAYHLFLYFKRREEVYNLYFTLLSITTFLYMLNRIGFFHEQGFDSVLGYRMELLSAYGIFPFIVAFMESLFFGKLSKLLKGISLSYAIIGIATLFSPPPILNQLLLLWQLSVLLGIVYTFYIFYKAIKEKSDNAKRLFFGFLILIVFSVFDILDSIIFKTGFHFARYAFFAFVTGIAVILANRFLNLYETIEDLNQSLEKKVELRTKELRYTLDQVRLLKEQQDGDYFLTTLIIQPLATNTASDDRLELDILMRQKKKFEFKKRVYEIGGDICISDIITLKEKKYTVFINGDAMGKSIQGAGGAIVLGVVFKSIISRTVMYKGNQNVYPERWLKIAFIELQKIFESFDGSMLVSIVIGLMDNESGFLYFINAEHPWSVLYRDEKASFLESGFHLRKVGMLGVEGSLKVKTFKMHKNDIIFIGSDGRDDIQLGEDETGRRIINENENLFLQTIEEAHGDLETILSITEKKGEITDDFSLLKIKYKGDEPIYLSDRPIFIENAISAIQKDKPIEALQILEQNKNEELGQYAKDYAQLVLKAATLSTRLQAGSTLLNEYIWKFPEDESAIYGLATLYFKQGQFEKATDLGEILKLRNPDDSKVLKLLVEIYSASGNHTRAEKLKLEVR